MIVLTTCLGTRNPRQGVSGALVALVTKGMFPHHRCNTKWIKGVVRSQKREMTRGVWATRAPLHPWSTNPGGWPFLVGLPLMQVKLNGFLVHALVDTASLETIDCVPPPLMAAHGASIMSHLVVKARITHPNGEFNHLFIVINFPKDVVVLGNDFGEQVSLVVEMEGPRFLSAHRMSPPATDVPTCRHDITLPNAIGGNLAIENGQ